MIISNRFTTYDTIQGMLAAERLLKATTWHELDAILVADGQRVGYLATLPVSWSYWHYERHSEHARALGMNEFADLCSLAWQMSNLIAQVESSLDDELLTRAIDNARHAFGDALGLAVVTEMSDVQRELLCGRLLSCFEGQLIAGSTSLRPISLIILGALGTAATHVAADLRMTSKRRAELMDRFDWVLSAVLAHSNLFDDGSLVAAPVPKCCEFTGRSGRMVSAMPSAMLWSVAEHSERSEHSMLLHRWLEAHANVIDRRFAAL